MAYNSYKKEVFARNKKKAKGTN